MSPLWSDMALARAALEKAAEPRAPEKALSPALGGKEPDTKPAIRRILRRHFASLAL